MNGTSTLRSRGPRRGFPNKFPQNGENPASARSSLIAPNPLGSAPCLVDWRSVPHEYGTVERGRPTHAEPDPPLRPQSQRKGKSSGNGVAGQVRETPHGVSQGTAAGANTRESAEPTKFGVGVRIVVRGGSRSNRHPGTHTPIKLPPIPGTHTRGRGLTPKPRKGART